MITLTGIELNPRVMLGNPVIRGMRVTVELILPDESRQAMYATAAAQVPAKRVGTAEDIANAVVFRAANTSITGIVLDVDGGRRLVP